MSFVLRAEDSLNLDGRKEIKNTCRHKNVLIIGSSKNVRDDLAQIDHKWEGDRMAVNDVGAYYHGKLDHWVSAHAELFKAWMYRRWVMSWHFSDKIINKPLTHTHYGNANNDAEYVDYRWNFPDMEGSGAVAAFIAMEMGYQKIVLAGIPADNSGRFTDIAGPECDPVNWHGCEKAVDTWKHERWKGRVVSLSGKTKEILGGLT